MKYIKKQYYKNISNKNISNKKENMKSVFIDIQDDKKEKI